MLHVEADQDLNIFLPNIQFVLWAYNLEVEVGNGASKSKPSGSCSESVGDSLSPSTVHEGIAFKDSINSWNRDGKFGYVRLKWYNSSVSDLHC